MVNLKRIHLIAEPSSGPPRCSPAMPVPLATEVETRNPAWKKKMLMGSDGALLDHKDIIEATKGSMSQNNLGIQAHFQKRQNT